jgi:hypothetical protein
MPPSVTLHTCGGVHLLTPLLLSLQPGSHFPALSTFVKHSFPCVQSSSVPHPHHPDFWHTGWFSGSHCDPFVTEHCVHSPASAPASAPWHAGDVETGQLSGGLVTE